MLGGRVPFHLPVTLDLDSRLYDLPFAYFGTTQPTRGAQVWTWQAGDQVATVLLQADRVIGAVLLGDVTSAGETLIQRHVENAPTTYQELDSLIGMAAAEMRR
jgi:hypothetical protein